MTSAQRAIKPFVRRVVVEALTPQGSKEFVVMHSTTDAPIRQQPYGPTAIEVLVRQFIHSLGGWALSIDNRRIGGIEDKLDAWESLYKTLEQDARAAQAANDPFFLSRR